MPTVREPGVVRVTLCAQSAAVWAAVGDDVAPVGPDEPVAPAPVSLLEPHATAMNPIATSPIRNFRIAKPPRSPAEMTDRRRPRPERGA